MSLESSRSFTKADRNGAHQILHTTTINSLFKAHHDRRLHHCCILATRVRTQRSGAHKFALLLCKQHSYFRAASCISNMLGFMTMMCHDHGHRWWSGCDQARGQFTFFPSRRMLHNEADHRYPRHFMPIDLQEVCYPDVHELARRGVPHPGTGSTAMKSCRQQVSSSHKALPESPPVCSDRCARAALLHVEPVQMTCFTCCIPGLMSRASTVLCRCPVLDVSLPRVSSLKGSCKPSHQTTVAACSTCLHAVIS